MSRIVASPEGRLLGGAMAVVELEYAQNWISYFETDAHDLLAIVDTDGVLLARTPPLPDEMGKRSQPPGNLFNFSEIKDTASSLFASPLDGRVRIYGLSRLERFPLIAIVGFDKENVLAGWQRRAIQFFVGYLFLVVLSILVMREHMITLRQREALRKISNTDGLTNIFNRRHFNDTFPKVINSAKRDDPLICFLLLDIDHFKPYNDNYGHQAGDDVLKRFSACLRESAQRASDMVFRLGGEEFGIIYKAESKEKAVEFANKVRQNIENLKIIHAYNSASAYITASMGLVCKNASEIKDMDEAYKQADDLLYKAKESGRNKVAY